MLFRCCHNACCAQQSQAYDIIGKHYSLTGQACPGPSVPLRGRFRQYPRRLQRENLIADYQMQLGAMKKTGFLFSENLGFS